MHLWQEDADLEAFQRVMIEVLSISGSAAGWVPGTPYSGSGDTLLNYGPRHTVLDY